LTCLETKERGVTIEMVCKRIDLFEGKIGHGFEFYVVGFYPSNTIQAPEEKRRAPHPLQQVCGNLR
jgi:hypothetical protein